MEKILSGLNAAQLRAVTAPIDGQLQILAGPGTGKTKVLTSRVAYLLLKFKAPPHSIIVTTFTNKAAKEMKQRLELMLENTGIDTKRLIVNTFHGVCLGILKRYSPDRDFKIAQPHDVSDILKGLIRDPPSDILSLKEQLDKGEFRNDNQDHISLTSGKSPGFSLELIKKHISSLKESGMDPEDYAKEKTHNKLLLAFYRHYNRETCKKKLMDFDDMLLKTYKLLGHRNPLTEIQHVFVDEYQDSNVIQTQLMSLFAEGNPLKRHCITVVGDPDQSIYGFRNVKSGNFKDMLQKFPETRVILLNENYRSTKHILDLSELIMRQQNDREEKNLLSNIPSGFPPVYKTFNSEEAEADFIAKEISRLFFFPQLLENEAVAILVRASHQTRALENSLISHRIPYSIMKGVEFWSRKEVTLVIDYLRVIAYKDDISSFLRILKFSCEGVADKAIKSIETALEDIKLEEYGNIVMAFEHLVEAKSFKANAKQISEFKRIIAFFKKMINLYYNPKNSSLENALEVLKLVQSEKTIEQYLIKELSRSENVQELVHVMSKFDPEDDIKVLFEEEEEEDNELEIEENFLQKFLTCVTLNSTTSQQSQKDVNVIISTIHASKGLEWPVVFIPGLSEGLLPAAFALGSTKTGDGVNEERRIFYVSTTRTKALLYLTYGASRRAWLPEPKESRFVTKKMKALTTNKQSAFSDLDSITKLYNVIKPGYNIDEAKKLQITKILATRKHRDKASSIKVQIRSASKAANFEYSHDSLKKSVGDDHHYKVQKKRLLFAPTTSKVDSHAPIKRGKFLGVRRH